MFGAFLWSSMSLVFVLLVRLYALCMGARCVCNANMRTQLTAYVALYLSLLLIVHIVVECMHCANSFRLLSRAHFTMLSYFLYLLCQFVVGGSEEGVVWQKEGKGAVEGNRRIKSMILLKLHEISNGSPHFS